MVLGAADANMQLTQFGRMILRSTAGNTAINVDQFGRMVMGYGTASLQIAQFGRMILRSLKNKAGVSVMVIT